MVRPRDAEWEGGGSDDAVCLLKDSNIIARDTEVYRIAEIVSRNEVVRGTTREADVSQFHMDHRWVFHGIYGVSLRYQDTESDL